MNGEIQDRWMLEDKIMIPICILGMLGWAIALSYGWYALFSGQ